MLEFGDLAVAHAIQLAVAPVFLLSGIGAILAVMTNRLSRIIDRARVLEERLVDAAPESFSAFHSELGTLSKRAKAIYRGHHLVHDDGAPHLHGDCRTVYQRVFTP